MSILKGEDKILQFTLTDDDGNPIVINNLIGLVVWIYQHQTVIAKYSVHVLVGYDPISIIDSSNGIIQINFKRSKIAGSLLQKIRAEIKISETNNNFDNNEMLSTLSEIEIDLLQDSLTKDVIIFV